MGSLRTPACKGVFAAETPIFANDELPEDLRDPIASDPAEFKDTYIAYVELTGT